MQRTTKAIDADLMAARTDKGKVKAQIERALAGVAELRSLYARIGGRIDGLLEEREAAALADAVDHLTDGTGTTRHA